MILKHYFFIAVIYFIGGEKMKVRIKKSLYYVSAFFCLFSVVSVLTLCTFITETKISNKMIFPVESGYISSSYGKRVNPITNKEEIHNGIDIAVPLGTEVLSSCDGVVYRVDNDEIYGNYILIKHSDIFFTKYCHLLSSNVSENEIVKIGECIGKAGKSGWATGSHLHFEIIKNNKNIDPMKLF